MKCPECAAPTRCWRTRHDLARKITYRIRICVKCGNVTKSIETIMDANYKIKEHNVDLKRGPPINKTLAQVAELTTPEAKTKARTKSSTAIKERKLARKYSNAAAMRKNRSIKAIAKRRKLYDPAARKANAKAKVKPTQRPRPELKKDPKEPLE